MVEVIRFYPEARSAHIERISEMTESRVLYFSKRDDFDVSLPGSKKFTQVTFFELFCQLARQRDCRIELPEPMWFKYFPQLLAIVSLIRLRKAFGIRNTLVTYAIENATADRVPRPLTRRWIPRPLWRFASRLMSRATLKHIDRIAFGSHGARDALMSTVGEGWYRRNHPEEELFPGLPVLCECGPLQPEPGRVLFLGALETRKGFDLLLKAWPTIRASSKSPLKLVVAGSGALLAEANDLANDPSMGVTVLGPIDRTRTHEELRVAKVLVLPSQPHFRWREQIGLPIVEAIGHQVQIVTSTETGLATWLEAHGAEVVQAPTDPMDLAVSVIRSSLKGVPAYDLPAVDSRLAADAWLMR